MTNIFFNLIDGESHPLTGSKVIIRPFSPPYYGVGSTLTTNSPVTLFSDITGSVFFPNVISGLYKVSISPAGANNPSVRNNLQNFANTIFYIQVPELSGSTINGIDCLTTQPTNTGTSSWTGSFDNPAFLAYTIDAANAIFVMKGGFIASASFANTASFAYTSISASWAPMPVIPSTDSASWASQSLSASLAEQSNNAYTASSLNAGSLKTIGTSITGANDIQSHTFHASAGYYGDGTNITGIVSASNALSASWAPGMGGGSANSASWASHSLSASYLQTPNNSTFITTNGIFTQNISTPQIGTGVWNIDNGGNAIFSGSVTVYGDIVGTASYANQALSASWAPAPLVSNSASWASASISASWAPTPVSVSYADQSGNSDTSISASHADSADIAISASWAPVPLASDSASWASQSLSASYARSSSFAKYAQMAGVAYNLNLNDVTTVDNSYQPVIWSPTGDGTFNVDQAMQYNPSTNVLTVTASKAISASWAPAPLVSNSASWASRSLSASHANNSDNALTASNLNVGTLKTVGQNITGANDIQTYTIHAQNSITASGGFYGDGSQITGVISASHSDKADNALNANTSSIAGKANTIYTEAAAILGDMYPALFTTQGPAYTQIWNTENVRINPGAGRITATEVSTSLLIGTASYATAISKSQVGPITITDLTNVATLYLVGDSGTGGHLSTIEGSPSGLNFNVQSGDFIGIGGPLHIGDHDVVAEDGKFLGTASYAESASWAISASWAPSTGGTTTSGRSIVLCSAFTPVLLGADAAQVTIPYSPTDGSSSINWNVKRLMIRTETIETTGSIINIEKSTVTGPFSAITIGTVNLMSGSYEGATTGSLGSVTSGDKIRFNILTLGTATNETMITEISNT